jgi:hypothetical protein
VHGVTSEDIYIEQRSTLGSLPLLRAGGALWRGEGAPERTCFGDAFERITTEKIVIRERKH